MLACLKSGCRQGLKRGGSGGVWKRSGRAPPLARIGRSLANAARCCTEAVGCPERIRYELLSRAGRNLSTEGSDPDRSRLKAGQRGPATGCQALRGLTLSVALIGFVLVLGCRLISRATLFCACRFGFVFPELSGPTARFEMQALCQKGVTALGSKNNFESFFAHTGAVDATSKSWCVRCPSKLN